MTPAEARAILLYLVLGYAGVLAGWLALHGWRDLRGRGRVRRGLARLAGGLGGLAGVGWLLW